MPVQAVESERPIRTAALIFTLVFLFIVQARLLEIFPLPGLAMVLAMVALLGALAGGNIAGAISAPLGKVLIVLTLWMAVTSPFSVWPGGSFNVLKDMWLKNVLVFFIIVAVVVRLRECVRVFHIMALATLAIVALSFRYADMSSGRLQFRQGTLANPNDFAAYLLIGVPFCMWAFQRTGNMLAKLLWLSTMGVLLFDVIKTGSRGGLLSLGLIMVILFLRANMVVRMGMAAGGVILLLSAPALLPQSVLERYMLIFSTSESNELETQQAEFAAGSTEGRSAMLKESLRLTFRNPLFGVGVGMFAVAAADDYKEQGMRAMWLQTHNLYTQVSSELGIVGLIIYLTGIYRALRNLRYINSSARRSGNIDLHRMSQSLSLSIYVFLLNGFFSSTAYHLTIIILFSISQIVRNAASKMITNLPAVPLPPERLQSRAIPR